jgi:hypothetical protein
MVSFTLCVSNEMPGTLIFMMAEKGIHVNVSSITYVYLDVGKIPPVLIQHHEQSALCICAYVCAYLCYCVCVVCACVYVCEFVRTGLPVHKKGSMCVCVCVCVCVRVRTGLSVHLIIFKKV